MAKEDQIDHPEMERKKVLVIKENPALVIKKNFLKKMTQENLVLTISKNLWVTPIIQNILVKKQKNQNFLMMKKKSIVLKEKKSLKKEADLSYLSSKNTVKTRINSFSFFVF